MYNINSHINVNFFKKLPGEAGNVPLVLYILTLTLSFLQFYSNFEGSEGDKFFCGALTAKSTLVRRSCDEKRHFVCHRSICK